jgi:Protein of unknown function (DUF2891)
MSEHPSLRNELANRIAPVVLANITRRYPYYDAHLFHEGETPMDPTSMHPAFGNSFDWHSSVHSHWTATQLLMHFSAIGELPVIGANLQQALYQNLSAANLTVEAAYLATHATYERPYGWAWTLRLAAGVKQLGINSLQGLSASLRPFAEQTAASSIRWLVAMPAPVRHGVHANTAFALSLMLEASRVLGFSELEALVQERARRWFSDDRSYPQAWERSGHDFLSPGLAEADLMRRLLPRLGFYSWWRAFLTDASPDAAIFAVVEVPKVSDGQIVHLHGLNLSRAGMLARIACTLGAQARRASRDDDDAWMLAQAERLYRVSIEAAVGDDYLSTHWLATFAWDAASSIDSAREAKELNG